MAESIEQLRIYKSARTLEDQIYELVKQFPADQFYALGNDLRRASAGVAHHIMEAHRLFSYRLKLNALDAMRREAESTQHYLEQAHSYGASEELASELIAAYTGIIKQSWGLTKWLKTKLQDKQVQAEIAAKEQMAGTTATATT